ncbi:MAG: phage GP46 family protein [Treponemataceae bacterium]
METGRIENYNDIRELVLMSIGTNKGSWFADKNFGSDLFLLQSEGKINGATAGKAQQMIVECLQWIIDDSLAQKIDVTVETEKNRLNYHVKIVKPDGNTLSVQEAWNGF